MIGRAICAALGALAGLILGAALSPPPPPPSEAVPYVQRQVDIRILDACLGDKHGPSWRVSAAKYECREVRAAKRGGS